MKNQWINIKEILWKANQSSEKMNVGRMLFHEIQSDIANIKCRTIVGTPGRDVFKTGIKRNTGNKMVMINANV